MNNVVNYKYKVSIILPCYNVACYIDNAVNAILKQTFTDYEVIFTKVSQVKIHKRDLT